MENLSITIYTCCASFFMFIKENLKETAFNYCAQWSVVADQKTAFSIISMDVTIWRIPLKGMTSTKRNAHPSPLPLTAASKENCPPENCPLTIIAPTQANSPKRVLRVKWVKICIVYEYYNIRVLQLRSKNRFTSIYFLQILTKPCRTPLIREQLSLNASWFSSARMQKKK